MKVSYTYYRGRTNYGSHNKGITKKTTATMKRIYRNDMQQAQKDKIAAANKGKTLSQQTKDRISRSMQKYWNSLPYKPNTDTQTGGTIQPTKPPYTA